MEKTIELGPRRIVGGGKKARVEYLEPKMTVVIAPIKARDSLTVDDLVSATASQVKANKIYAICSIRSINGEAFHPIDNPIEYDDVWERFAARPGGGLMELGELVDQFRQMVNEAAVATDPKSSSGAPPSGA